VAQVVLENVYKSFSPRKGENLSVQKKSPDDYQQTDRPELERQDTITVLRRINLAIADGEFMVLVGPSGCGKSTLLRLIAGLETMTGGNIWINNQLINDLPPKDRNIAMVFQNYALYPHMTVYENIAFGLRRRFGGEKAVPQQNHQTNVLAILSPNVRTWGENMLVGLTRKFPKNLRYISAKEQAVDEQVRSVAQLLQIEGLLNRLPKQLSGGQRQRVALGRAIARNPQVFLMDEPLSNLDAKLRAETRSQIVKLQRQLGTTTIYVTHDQTEAMTMGDRIAIMSAGKIQQVATPLELYNRPANCFVAEFIGSPPMNFIPIEFHGPLLISHANFRFTLPESWGSALQEYDGQRLILGIRPEHFSLSVPATKNLSVQVELVENLGQDTFLTVKISKVEGSEVNGQSLQVRVPPDKLIRSGEQIWLSFIPEKLHFFDPETQLAVFPRSPVPILPIIR